MTSLMKRLLVGCTLMLSFGAFADDAPPPMGPAARKPVKKDVKGIEALLKAGEEAWKKGDIDAAAELHDFPIYMLTDSMAGVPDGGLWSKEQWLATMKPMAANMPKDAKVTSKPKITMLSDSLAVVVTDVTHEVNKKKESWTEAGYVVNRDGKWLFKSSMEAGWGDVPMAGAAAPKDAMKPAPAGAPAKTK